MKNYLRYISALLIILLLITFSASCKIQLNKKLEEIEHQYSQEYRQGLERIEDKEYLAELLNDDELINLLNNVFVWEEDWFYKLTSLKFSNDELKLVIKTEESLSGNDQYRLEYLEYITAKDSDIYLSSLSLKEYSELFEKLYEIDYPVENILSLFTNIKQSLQDNNEDAKIALLSDPFLSSSEEFLLFYKAYAASESERELIDFIDSTEDISYQDKLYLFEKFRNSNILEIADEIKLQDNQIYEDILGINKLGFFNISNFLKKEDIKEFISYIKEIKSIDQELYDSYIKYNPESFLALQEVSKYYDEDKILEYRPTPDSVLKLYNIILDIPEEHRLDYIENSFKSAYAVIIRGSEDLPSESVLFYIEILKELNIPYFIISNIDDINDLNVYHQPACSILDKFPLNKEFDIFNDIVKILDSLNGKDVIGVRTIIKTKNEFIDILKKIIEENDTEILNIFIDTHGSVDALYFEVQDYYYWVYPNDLINIFNDLDRENKLFIGSCHSNKFANYFKGIPNIKVVSISDKITWGGNDLPYSILISMKSNNYRIEMEELMDVSNEINPDYEDEYGYHYIVDNSDYMIVDEKFREDKQGEFDIKFTNFKDENSILYYHVESLNNIEISSISPYKSSLIEEKNNDIFNYLNPIIPFINNVKIEKCEFPIEFDGIEDGRETY